MSVTEPVRFQSYSDARAHLKVLLDAAAEGRSALVQRADDTLAVVDGERLRQVLLALVPAVEVVAEGDGWSVFLPGTPIAADGATFDEAVDETVDALREYAADWEARLRTAPNHADNWGLAQLVALSGDDELRAWLVGAG